MVQWSFLVLKSLSQWMCIFRCLELLKHAEFSSKKMLEQKDTAKLTFPTAANRCIWVTSLVEWTWQKYRKLIKSSECVSKIQYIQLWLIKGCLWSFYSFRSISGLTRSVTKILSWGFCTAFIILLLSLLCYMKSSTFILKDAFHLKIVYICYNYLFWKLVLYPVT